jgi:hypothetical protein
MSDQDSGPMGKWPIQYTVMEQMVSNICINGTEWVVKQHYLTVVIGRPCNTNSLLLTAGQRNSLFTNEGPEQSAQRGFSTMQTELTCPHLATYQDPPQDQWLE